MGNWVQECFERMATAQIFARPIEPLLLGSLVSPELQSQVAPLS